MDTATATEAADDKPKFSHLVKGEDDGETADDEGEGDTTDEDAAEPGSKLPGGYDLKACANDMMGAFQSGDVESLEMALEDLVEKVRASK